MNSIVSIITPSFNRAHIIHETAISIFNQTYPCWEWVIVDDGSTDHSWNVISKYAEEDPRVKIFKRNHQPKGACACRNIAIEKCTGKYLLFLDTDDILASNCLQQRVTVMEQNPDADFAIFSMYLFKKDIHDMNILWNIDKPIDDLRRLLIGDPICQGTGTLWKKDSFVTIGMWNEELMLWQDIELHIRSFLWPMKYVKRMDLAPDAYLRITDNSLSRSGYYTEPKTKSRLQVFAYAVKTIAERQLLSKYADALRYLGFDLFSGMVSSRRLNFIRPLLDILNTYKLITKEENKYLITHYRIHQLRLHKLRMLDKYYHSKVSSLTSQAKEKSEQMQLQH